jgi:hypothetical protein
LQHQLVESAWVVLLSIVIRVSISSFNICGWKSRRAATPLTTASYQTCSSLAMGDVLLWRLATGALRSNFLLGAGFICWYSWSIQIPRPQKLPPTFGRHGSSSTHAQFYASYRPCPGCLEI